MVQGFVVGTWQERPPNATPSVFNGETRPIETPTQETVLSPITSEAYQRLQEIHSRQAASGTGTSQHQPSGRCQSPPPGYTARPGTPYVHSSTFTPAREDILGIDLTPEEAATIRSTVPFGSPAPSHPRSLRRGTSNEGPVPRITPSQQSIRSLPSYSSFDPILGELPPYRRVSMRTRGSTSVGGSAQGQTREREGYGQPQTRRGSSVRTSRSHTR